MAGSFSKRPRNHRRRSAFDDGAFSGVGRGICTLSKAHLSRTSLSLVATGIFAPMSMLVAALILGVAKVGIKDTKVGTGLAAQPFDRLTVEYTGKLAKGGKQFDTSIGRAPFSLDLGVTSVIKGWQEGLVGMKVGGTRVLSIPAELGYGAAGSPPDIPANADLVFTVTLKSLGRAKITTLKKGTGPATGPKDSVEVHYKGMLADGKVFDTSYGRDTFLVNMERGGVIVGFQQGLYGIRKGEKRRVVIPPTLGYGERGAGDAIPPNATITFELEAVRVFPAR
ncbi:FKBP-type peptidyl-prolyl cis-trans isomerase [bacterium]|nr:MAG: FKBP-type peptidyl-prolyl cis-trans isomerase [bacterium]